MDNGQTSKTKEMRTSEKTDCHMSLLNYCKPAQPLIHSTTKMAMQPCPSGRAADHLEDIRETTSASARMTPHRHFSQKTCRQASAQPRAFAAASPFAVDCAGRAIALGLAVVGPVGGAG